MIKKNKCNCILHLGKDCDPQRRVVSRIIGTRPHKCSECGATIEPGESYERAVGVWVVGIRAKTFRTCNNCMTIRETFFCDGYYYRSIIKDLDSYVLMVDGEVSEDCLAPLAPRAREMVCDMIEAIWTSVAD